MKRPDRYNDDPARCAMILEGVSGVKWELLTPSLRDLYSVDSDFILEGDPTGKGSRVLAIRNPHPERREAPGWAISTSCADIFDAKAGDLIELLGLPGVIDIVCGRYRTRETITPQTPEYQRRPPVVHRPTRRTVGIMDLFFGRR